MPVPQWQVTTLPVAGDWLGVKYGGGRFIAHQSFSSAGAYSDNRGATWNALNFPTTGITSIGYIAGVWLAIGVTATTATLWKSTDGGITWAEIEQPRLGAGSSDYYWKALVECNGRLYIFANGGTYYANYTTDGTTWNRFELPFMGGFTSMAYGNGAYVAVQSGKSEHMTSWDGVSWQSINMPGGTYNGMDVAFGSGVFVIPGTARGMIAKSANGQTWEAVSVSDHFWTSIAYGSGTFVAVNNDTRYVYHSDDGATWASQQLETGYFNDVHYADSVFLAMPNAYAGNSATAIRASFNQPPPTPSGITYGQPKAGEALTISTGGSIDPDGDAVTYVWERSTDVQYWHQIASGAALSITDTVPTDSNRISYRVKAVDANGAGSGYAEGPVEDIYYNQPPGVPASISFGIPKAGKQLAITCAVVTDPEGDSFSYVWERSIDGGVFSQIGITTINAINDTVPMTGTTYNVRVKTVDSRGNESAYRTGTAQAIDHNVAPTISGSDANRGTVAAPFSYAYTITDTDAGDALTVVEAVDGVEIRRFSTTSGTSHTADISDVWLPLVNGIHRLTITVSDQDGASATRTITFARQTTRIAACRKIALNVRPTKVFLSLFPLPPAGTSVTVQVCNNPFDPSPTWENISGKQNALVHTFTNTSVANGNGLGYRFIIDPADGQTASFFEAVVRYA